MSKQPAGTITFIFTDIQGSTRLWEQYPEAMNTALARHDAILREAVLSHQGYVVKMRGDGIHAAFTTTQDAISAVLDAEHALRAEPWGETGRLRVRYAMHAGTVQARDGDYFGPPVNRAARLLSAGHGDQVLLSLAAEELVCDDLPGGTSLLDLGEHRLKDLTRPERIFQLVIPGLPAEFPPLLTLDAHPTNLPVQPTPLIGREKQIDVLKQLLDSRARLVTLTGPGGVGKTRLGLQAAADLCDSFEDGVYWVNLAPLLDPSLVISTITQVLGVMESGSQSLLESLKEFIRPKKMLLLLDNFEQVIAAAPQVADLLYVSAPLRILVTSREPLRLRGEHEFPVAPLALPDLKQVRNQAEPAAAISQYAAVALFIQTALAVKPDFAVTNQNALAVAEICVRLDGLPLAIELAAARSKLLSPQAILARMQSSLAFLTSGARDLPARHQALRSTIAWSYDLLGDSAKKLFRRLAVFAGGWTLEAAEAVCNVAGDLNVDVLDEMESLLDNSLLTQSIGEDGEMRFGMLETIREYAMERLLESGEIDHLRQRQAQFYLALIEQAEPELIASDQARWVNRLNTEHGNIRAVLTWSQQHAVELGLKLCGSIWHFWDMRSFIGEGRSWLETFIAQSPPPTAARGKALQAANVFAVYQGEYETAQAHMEEALSIFQQLGDQQGIATAFNELGVIARYRGECAAARQLFEQSLAIKRELGNEWLIANSVMNLGLIASDQSDYASAYRLHQESLAIYRALDEKHGIAMASGNLGHVAMHLGRLDEARVWQAESLQLFKEVGDNDGLTECLERLAMLANANANFRRAAQLFGAASVLRKEAGTSLAPVEQAECDGALNATHAQLDAATFDTAWAEGQAMTMEQIVDEVIKEA